ncbi:fimbrillin family protein [Phocaeicola faecalis]|uniref:fimbrillin family protein n=1 Tax=Phocaeicola faecalis TaxID=2786956 RepID=UPI001F21F92F|nr:fimbrillin family protein [Phocaeicola faecalis]
MMIYKLQGCKKSAVIGWMAGMLLLAGCTQDKPADTSQGEMLPEGKYPMTFTVTGLEATATTRGTTDGTWDGGKEVAVQVGDVVKKYVADGSGESTTLQPADSDDAFYWQNTKDTKQVSAWYLGKGYNNNPPTKTRGWQWSVQSDQNNNGYQNSDFLYAPQTACSFGGTNSLTFSHKTAKVVINIRKYGVATDDKDIESITICNTMLTGSTAEINGELKFSGNAESSSSRQSITPYKLSVQNENVSFEANKHAETALASYQALVIPDNDIHLISIEIKMKGYALFKYNLVVSVVPGVSGKWESGMQYTYNLTIKGSKVTATVSDTEMTWEDGDNGGSGGNGSVEI